ncbi:WG repeat-containing protein [Bacteroides caecimuris]|uniref:WG repeat-containing protein n=1 Tax=Bacteroides caecimuris TaxID=1796613 RepID=UPI00263B896D|nr:WG repeat-containing protein [Bacteroides caecimuris]
MKTNIITIILLVFISINIFAQDNKLYIYWPDFDKDETICGYVDSNGEIVIPAGKYPNIFTAEFDKIAFVLLKDKKGVYAIDRSEKILFQICSFEFGPDIISNGLFRIIENGKIGFANMNGEIVIKPNWEFIFPFQENGLAIFCEKGNWIWIDKEHRKFSGGKWGAMDTKGNIVIPAMYDDGKENYLKKDGKWYKVKRFGDLESK